MLKRENSYSLAFEYLLRDMGVLVSDVCGALLLKRCVGIDNSRKSAHPEAPPDQERSTRWSLISLLGPTRPWVIKKRMA